MISPFNTYSSFTSPTFLLHFTIISKPPSKLFAEPPGWAQQHQAQQLSRPALAQYRGWCPWSWRTNPQNGGIAGWFFGFWMLVLMLLDGLKTDCWKMEHPGSTVRDHLDQLDRLGRLGRLGRQLLWSSCQHPLPPQRTPLSPPWQREEQQCSSTNAEVNRAHCEGSFSA